MESVCPRLLSSSLRWGRPRLSSCSPRLSSHSLLPGLLLVIHSTVHGHWAVPSARQPGTLGALLVGRWRCFW